MQKKYHSFDFQAFLFFLLAGGLCVAADLPVASAYAKEVKTAPKALFASAEMGEERFSAPAIEEPLEGVAGSFLAGQFAAKEKDLFEAAIQIQKTLTQDPENIELRHEAMRLCLLAGLVPDAIALAETLREEAEADSLVATLLMLKSVKEGDFATAQAVIEKAPASALFGVARPMMLEWLRVASGEVVGQVDLQPSIDRAGFFAPFVIYHAALMNDLLGNDAGAGEAYRKSIADPELAPYRVVEAAANFFLRQGNPKEASALYAAYQKANPDSTLTLNLPQAGQEQRPLVANATEGLAELFFTTASILFGEDATQDTFLYLRIALELRPDLPPAQLMLGSLYEQMGDYSHAIATYEAIDASSIFYLRAQIRKALNLEKMGKRASALKVLSGLETRFPKDVMSSLTRGDMLREAKDYDAAVEAYGMAIARSAPLQSSDWPLLYARGVSYERAGDWDNAEADFLKALALEPDQPDVLNYLSYSWLMMHKNIKKARDYLTIAVSLRPEDPSILDSLGFAYYLSGDFESAMQSFEKALGLMSEDPVVNEHLGDAYWRVGRENEARFQWRRAKSLTPKGESTEGLEKKIEEGLPPFLMQHVRLEGADAPEPRSSAEEAGERSDRFHGDADAPRPQVPSSPTVIPFQMQAQ